MLPSSHDVRQAELLIDAAASQPALSEDADTVGARKACTSCKNIVGVVGVLNKKKLLEGKSQQAWVGG